MVICLDRGGFHEISHREWLAGYESAAVIVTSENLKKEIQFLYQIPDVKMKLIGNRRSYTSTLRWACLSACLRGHQSDCIKLRVVEAVKTLPLQSKIVLSSVLVLSRERRKGRFSSGEVHISEIV